MSCRICRDPKVRVRKGSGEWLIEFQTDKGFAYARFVHWGSVVFYLGLALDGRLHLVDVIEAGHRERSAHRAPF